MQHKLHRFFRKFSICEFECAEAICGSLSKHYLGSSDHTPGHSTALGAVALGARVIGETFYRPLTNRQGPDHSFSMTPITFKEMVLRTQELQASLGKSEKTIENNELETVVIQRRCLRAAHDLQKGVHFQVRPECPASVLIRWIASLRNRFLVGKTLKKTLKAGHHIRKTDQLVRATNENV